MAYITGHRAFWTIDLEVGPGALIPRPDSETLIAAAVEHFAGTPVRRASSTSAPGRERCCSPRSTNGRMPPGWASTPPPVALSYAQRNAERLGLSGRAALQIGDWAKGLTSRFDLILCNPPYVATDAETGPGRCRI